eukprot:scaffold93286_cov33-Phaeocystis_antarctica.AAC.1
MAWSRAASCAEPRLRPQVLLGRALRSEAGGAQQEGVPGQGGLGLGFGCGLGFQQEGVVRVRAGGGALAPAPLDERRRGLDPTCELRQERDVTHL